MKNTYTIEHDFLGAGITVMIDDEKATDKLLGEINSFWSGDDYRLDEEDGNLLFAVLKLLAQTAIRIQYTNNYNTVGVVDEFTNLEGWPPMDGSYGFTITNIFPLEIHSEDLAIQQMKTA